MIVNGNKDPNSGKEIRGLKILRLLKLTKLLRVARLKRMLERYREQLRVFMAAFGGFVLALAFVLFSHLLACIWYFVGTVEQLREVDADGDVTPAMQGWVQRNFGVDCHESIVLQETAAADALAGWLDANPDTPYHAVYNPANSTAGPACE